MFGKRIDLFKLSGFEVRIDLSWVFLAILIAWSLSAGLFPFRYEGLSSQTYWIMGIVGAIGFFFSIVVHELSHSLVARHFGIPIHGITLFLFGGVAEMKKETPSPKAEFMIAAVGPLSSILLAAGFYLVAQITQTLVGPRRFTGSLSTWPGSMEFWPFSTSFPLSLWMGAVFCALRYGAGRTTCDGPPGLPPDSAPDSA